MFLIVEFRISILLDYIRFPSTRGMIFLEESRDDSLDIILEGAVPMIYVSIEDYRVLRIELIAMFDSLS